MSQYSRLFPEKKSERDDVSLRFFFRGEATVTQAKTTETVFFYDHRQQFVLGNNNQALEKTLTQHTEAELLKKIKVLVLYCKTDKKPSRVVFCCKTLRKRPAHYKRCREIYSPAGQKKLFLFNCCRINALSVCVNRCFPLSL